jgi:FAD:protein FMN transferase
MQYQDSFRAMNTDIDVVVDSSATPISAFLNIRLLFERQEERFSRFRPSSLLSRLNDGEEMDDEWLARACRMALEAHDFTGGLFNPMVLPALRDAGYVTTFDDVRGGAPVPQAVPDPRLAIKLDGNSVRLREGQVDLGGLVKGWTVDLAVEAFVAECPNLLVNAGGDLRCAGEEEGVDGWFIGVAGADGEGQPWEGLMRGALATSTTRKRRWTTDSGATAHHLIDPRTGLPANSPYTQVSAWHEQTWIAECWAKAVLIGGRAAREHAEQSLRVLAL